MPRDAGVGPLVTQTCAGGTLHPQIHTANASQWDGLGGGALEVVRYS